MTDAERLQDAIGLLPEELLSPVDALRRQKRFSWKPIAAVAASFLLVAGLYQLQPLKKSAENGAFLVDADGNAKADRYVGNSAEHSTNLSAYFLTAKITEVTEDYLVVTLSEGDNAKVFLEDVKNPGEFSPGEEITLLFAQEPDDRKALYPNKILKN